VLGTETGLVVGDIGKKAIAFRTVKDGEVSVYTDASGLVWFGCDLNLCRFENQSATEVGAANGLPLDRWDAIVGISMAIYGFAALRRYIFAPTVPRALSCRPDFRLRATPFPTLALDPAGHLLVPQIKGWRAAERLAGKWSMPSRD
jgi:hypothetical protein